MRRITDKIRDIKGNLTPILQPLTEEELYLRIHPKQEVLPLYEHPVSTPVDTSPYHNLKLDITIQQWIEPIAYDRLLERVFFKQLKNSQYLFELCEKENMLCSAQKQSLSICWEPCYQTVVEGCHVEQVDNSLKKVTVVRETLTSLKKSVYQSHQNMKKTLLKLKNMKEYLRKVKQLKENLKKYYDKTDPGRLAQALGDESFKKYALYENLMQNTHKLIHDLESQASEKLKNSLLSAECPTSPYLSLMKFQSTHKIIKKAAKEAVRSSLYSAIITSLDDTVYALDNIDGILSALQPESVPKLLKSMFTTVHKLLHKPTQFTTQEAELCRSTVKTTAGTYLRVFIDKLKYKLTCIQLNNLTIIKQLLQFSNEISPNLQQFVINTLQQCLVEQITQYTTNIPVDIESQQWLLHDIVHQCCCKWLAGSLKQSRQLIMVFSLFNCLRRLQMQLVYVFMFDSSRILLINQYENCIKQYIRCLVRAYFREDVRDCCQKRCPNLYSFIGGQGNRVEIKQNAIEALQISLEQFVGHLEEHRLVLQKVTDVLDFNMAALREIPAFLQIVFVECMSQKVDLAEVESMGWPTNNTTHDGLVDSLKLHYCHIMSQESKDDYIRSLVRRIVDILSHKKMNKESGEAALDYFEAVREELLEVGIILNNDIDNYILAKVSGDNDPCRMELAKSRVGIYTRRSLSSLARTKHQQQQIKALLNM